ncbi:MAG: YmdB family metallophosphoesterase [Spirochaetales bacterium]|nr:MAG: YmdB family metallophosphoesterase [Spirochaetales bacterium]
MDHCHGSVTFPGGLCYDACLLRVLFVAEIVGKAGVFCVKSLLPDLRKEFEPDLVIANADGATGGFGLGKNHSIYLRKLGVDVITGGDQIYFKKDMVDHIESAYYILRPANYPTGVPGRGWRLFGVPGGKKIAVISMLGQSGYDRVHLSNPYTYLPELIGRAHTETPHVIVDFHAVTTAEKNTMFHHLDGTVSAILGTGTRVQTGDAAVMPGGTAVITDTGRTGSIDSVGGLDPGPELRKFLTQVLERATDTWASLQFQGAVVDTDEDGKAVKIQTLQRECKENSSDRTGTGNID